MKLVLEEGDVIKFNIGEYVYHVTEPEKAGVVTRVSLSQGGAVYCVQWDKNTERFHFDFELTREKSFAEPKQKEQ